MLCCQFVSIYAARMFLFLRHKHAGGRNQILSHRIIFFQAYYRQGVALQCLGRHAEALGAFSSGLAQDPKSQQLLSGLIEAAMKSPLKGEFSAILPCKRGTTDHMN